MQEQDREFNKFMVQRFTSVCKIVEAACDAAPVEYGTKVPKDYIKVPYNIDTYNWSGGMNAAWDGEGHLQNLEEQWAGINSNRGQREIIQNRNYGHRRCGYMGVGTVNFERYSCLGANTFIRYARMPVCTDPLPTLYCPYPMY